MGMFDDLVPAQQTEQGAAGGLFDDLIPPSPPPAAVDTKKYPYSAENPPPPPKRVRHKEHPTYVSEYIDEAGRAVARGATNFVGQIYKGASAGSLSDTQEADSVAAEFQNIPKMDDAQFAQFYARALKLAHKNPDAQRAIGESVRMVRNGQAAPNQALGWRQMLDTRTPQETAEFKTGQAIQDYAQRQFPQAPEFKDSWTSTIAEAGGSTLPYLATALAGPLSLPLGMLAGIKSGEGEALDRALQHPGTTNKQVLDAATWGAIPGATEQLPIEYLLRRIPVPVANKFGKLVVELGKQAFAEGGQEAVNQLGQNLVENYVYNPDKDLTEGVLEAAGIGAIVGGTMQVAVDGGASITDKIIGKPKDPGTTAAPGKTDRQTRTANTDGFSVQSKGQRIEPRLFDDLIPETQQNPASDAKSDNLTETRQFVRLSEMDETDILRQTGYSLEQIADMNPAERAQAAQEARQQGIEPIGTIAPGAPPVGTSATAPGFGTRKQRASIQTDQDMAAVRPVVNAQPSEAQAAAGNYQKGHINLHGLDISIENPKGSVRRGTDPDTGEAWQSPSLPADYGYVKGTKGKDGDHVDVYIGPNPQSDRVYVIDQVNLKDGKFDEHKAVLAANSPQEAVDLYVNSFDVPTLDRIGDVTEMSVDEFKAWSKNGRATKRPAGQIPQQIQPDRLKVTEQAPVEPVDTAQSLATADKAFDSYMASRKPLTPEGFAAASGLDVKAAGRAIQRAALAGRVIQTRSGKWVRAPQRSTPINAVEFIASLGGIQDVTGELKGMDLPKMTPYGPVVRKTGLHPDKVREALVEAGYLQDAGRDTGGQAQTTADDVYQLLDAHLRGQKAYSVQDQAWADDVAATKRNEQVDPEWRPVHPVAQIHGLETWEKVQSFFADSGTSEETWSPQEVSDAARMVAQGMDAGDAFERAAFLQIEERSDPARDDNEFPEVIQWMQQREKSAMEMFGDTPPFPDVEQPSAAQPSAVEKEGDGSPQPGEQAGLQPEDQADASSNGAEDAGARPVRGEEGQAGPVTAVEPGADNRPQTVIPGAEQDIEGALKKAAKKPLKSTKPQKGMDVGLFGDAPNSPDLFDKPIKSATSAETTSAAAVSTDPVEKPTKTASPGAYGSNNTLVSKDRAAELRDRLKAKLKGQLNAGIDPEVVAIGTELAVYHIEAGTRRFVDFAKAIATDLDTSIKAIRPYLRSWYNGARDMMEDAGLDVAGMDSPDEVKAALAVISEETTDEPGDGLREAAPGVPSDGAPQSVPGHSEEGRPDGALPTGREPGRGNVREPKRQDADQPGPPAGVPEASGGAGSNPADGGRNRPSRNRPAAKPASVDTELQEAEAERIARRALDYRITDADEIGQGGPKQKVARNIEAIRTLKTILDEKRQATPDEKKVLVRYVGWGAFAQDVFAKHKPEWQKERAALADLLTAEEFASARASTLNAHYTSADVIKGMWDALSHLGFKGGRALEPSSGIGHFIGLTPDSVHAQTEWSAVELDTLTGNIAKLLYSGSNVNVTGFEKFNRPTGFYDLAISNVPFGDYTLRDTKRPAMLIHDYFFVKGLDLVRPGGLVSFITSSGTLDKQSDAARREIAKRADFLGAIRLPGGKKGAFSGNAGTEVTTDIIFLRRKVPGLAMPDAPQWLGLKQIETPDGPIAINEYFAANPNMMLGEMRLTGTMYRDKSPVLVGDAEGLQARIAKASQSMPEAAMLPRSSAPKVKETATVQADGDGKEGGYFIKDGKLYRKIEGVGRPENLAGTDTEKIRMLLPIRDAINQLLSNQGRGITKGNADLRSTLNKSYDAFVRKYGPINLENVTVTNRVTRSGDFVTITKRPNFSKFSFDPDAFKVAAIENYDPDTKKATKAAIFDSDILGAPPEPQITSDADAIGWSLNAFGKLDIPQMALLTGKSEQQLVRDLGDLVYENPSTGEHEPAAQYLAGDVVAKLDDAKGAAESDPRRYSRNIAALDRVQPEPLSRDDIRVPFGAPWVPGDVYSAFFRDELDSDVTLSMNPISKKWQIKSARFSSAASTKYATARMPMDKIVEHAIQMTPPRVTVRDQDGKEILLKEETEEAMIRVGNLRDAFSGSFDGAVQGWIWNDDERAVRLEALYNKSFNRLVPQKFDGSHLTFPGLTATITDSAGQKVPFRLRDHQKNAVARIIQNGNTLLDHVVGAGKTFTMIAAGMEQRRLGQTQRPMFIVPNHMLEQFSREFLQAYPGANILVAQKDEMTRENRKAFAAKIASQKWDGIIITHDAFGRMAMSNEAYIEFTQAEIAQVLQAKENAAIEEGKKSPTIKDLEKLQKRLEAKLAQLQNKERKDDGVMFEELGVDQLYLDEAHLFKNLSFFTRHTRIKGIGGTASQRATDLYMKIRHLEKTRPQRSAVFATGTPISNTMAEMFTMQRYLQGDTLKDYGVDEFDAWAATFGEVKSAMELGPDGRTLRETTSFSRFINIPELVAMYSRVADSQTADMLNLPRPKRKNGRITIEEAEFSDAEEQRALAIVNRAMDLKGKKSEKGMDNMLKVVGDGRKLATDVRLLDPNAPYNPNGKTARLIANVFDRWKDAKFPAIAQMIFLDMGVPQSKAAAKAAAITEDEDFSEDADGDAAEVMASRFDLYADIRDRLVSRGIPREQIAFIHEANDDTKKARMFAKVRNGEIRVLMGSTGKMGVGTNVQRLLTALHHDDAPWKPAEVEQRDGRIERQGNLNEEIEIIRYVTKKSMDAFMWQTLERKAAFIGQLKAGAKGVRHAEDIDSPLPEAADMKAAATGDPRIMEQAEITKRARELTVAKSNHTRVQTESRRQSFLTKARITHLEGEVAKMEKDAPLVKPTTGDAFTIDLDFGRGQRTFTTRKDAGEAIRRWAIDRGRTMWGPPRKEDIGQISGLGVSMALQQTEDGVQYAFTIEGNVTYGQPVMNVLTEDADPLGLVRRIENILKDVPAMLAYQQAELDRARVTLTKLEAAAVEKPFPRQKEYDEVHDRLKVLNAELKAEGEAAQRSTPAAAPSTPEPQAPLSSLPRRSPTPSRVRAAVLRADLRNIAATILGHQVSDVRLVDDMEAAGYSRDENAVYDPSDNIITIAMDVAQDPRTSLRHEAIHALREAGVFTPQEWSVLSRLARTRWIDQHDIRNRYDRMYRERFAITGDQVEELLIEEAIAEAFADYRANPGGEDLVSRIFDRVMRFLEAVANMARGHGFTTSADVFGAVDRGEIAGRQRGQGQSRDFLLYGRQDSLSRPITARTMVELKAKIYAAEGWQRKAGESQAARIKAVYNVVLDHKNNRIVATRKPAILSSRRRLDPPRNPAAGSFDAPHDERVREALADSTDTILNRIARAGKAAGIEGRRKVQDREIDLLRTQAAIAKASGPIAEPKDAYLAASLYPGRVAQRDRDLVTDVIEPLVADIARRGLTLEDVDQFNRARHAFERNLEIGKLYKPGQQFHDAMFNPSIVGGSGMSDDQASDILNAAQQSGKYADLEAVGDNILAMNAKTLDSLLAEGLIDQEYYDSLKAKYRYYVPLRGHDEATDDTHPDTPRTGSRYDIRGKEFSQAFGRTSAADSTIAYSILQARQAIIRIEKNRVGKRFLRLAQANPNEAFWQVNRRDMKKVIDKNTGLVRNAYDPGTTQAENVYAVKVGGKAYHVTIHHQGLLKAMKGIGAENMHGLVVAFYKINRFLAGMNTSYDPEFIFRNLLRDLQQTGIVLQEEKIRGLTRNVLKSMPKAAAGMNAMLRGDTNTEWSRYARDYADAGGKMGFMGMNDIATEKASLERLMKEQNPSASLKAWMVVRDEVVGRLDRYNDSIENTLRLATYVHMRKAGVSRDKAASAARELTVNFNRKGEWSSGINAFYMFFNAAMQGGATMAMRLARSKAVRRVCFGIMVAAFLQDMLNRMLAGDDDDGENRYDKIPDEIKAKNGIIMLPKALEEKYGVPYLKWPLPLGYNMFHIAGTQVGHAVAGARSPLEAAGETVGAVADAFNPLGTGGTLLNFFAPTLLDPAADIATNTDYFGEDIMPRSYDDTQPNSDRYKPNIAPWAKAITDFLNEATGGSPERKGAVDWSPEWVEHIFDFAAGGVGRLISRSSTVADNLMKGDDVDANKVPFARVFTGQSSKFTDRDTYNQIKDAVHVTEKEIEARKAEGDTQEVERLSKKYGRELRMIEVMKTAERQMTKLRKDYRAMKGMQGIGEKQRKERLDAISRRMDAIQLMVRQRWNSAP